MAVETAGVDGCEMAVAVQACVDGCGRPVKTAGVDGCEIRWPVAVQAW